MVELIQITHIFSIGISTKIQRLCELRERLGVLQGGIWLGGGGVLAGYSMPNLNFEKSILFYLAHVLFYSALSNLYSILY